MSESAAPKKKSLSSYLSRVHVRKEELNKLDAEEKEREQSETPVPTVVTNETSEPQNTASSEKHEDKDMKSVGAVEVANQDLDALGKREEEEKAVAKEEKTAQETLEKDDNDTHQSAGAEPAKEAASEMVKNEVSEPILKTEATKSEVEEKQAPKTDVEVDSDAPTEAASPPRPRKRLIRQDQLERRSVSVPADSDSELSDIENINDALASSVGRNNLRLAVDSSPVKPRMRKKSIGKAKKKVRLTRDHTGRTKLHHAAEKDNVSVALAQIELGADVNDKDNAGYTPLHIAALQGHFEMVKLLLDNDATINIPCSLDPHDTPLFDAVANDHVDVVRLLLERGANPTFENSEGAIAVDEIRDDATHANRIRKMLKEATANYRKNHKITEHAEHLHSPVKTNLVEDFTFSGPKSERKILEACRENDQLFVHEYIAQHMKVPHAAFMAAVKAGHNELVSILIALGSDVNKSSENGMTPLMQAVGRGHIKTSEVLLNSGADATATNHKGKSVLDFAKGLETGLLDNDEVEMVESAISKKLEMKRKRKEERKDEAREEARKIEEEDERRRKKKEDSKRKHEHEEFMTKRKRRDSEAVSMKATDSIDEQRGDSDLQKHDESKRKRAFEDKHEHPAKKSKHEHKPEVVKVGLSVKESSLLIRESTSGRETPKEVSINIESIPIVEQTEKVPIHEEKALATTEKTITLAEQVNTAKEDQPPVDEKEMKKSLSIREFYTNGLKKIFQLQKTVDPKLLGPVYYITKDNTKFVLDIQMIALCFLLGIEQPAVDKKVPISELSMKYRVFSIYKSLLLWAGEKPYSGMSVTECKNFQDEEFKKFQRLNVNWVPLEPFEKIKPLVPFLETKLGLDISGDTSLPKPIDTPVRKVTDVSHTSVPPKFKRKTINILMSGIMDTPRWNV